jgi:uncharacterized protein YqeY
LSVWKIVIGKEEKTDMLNEKINTMIMSAMKDKENDKAAVYRLIKNEFLKFSTAKNAKPLDDAAEITILQKMVKQREESIADYTRANRMDLVESEQKEVNILKELLPQAPTKDDVMVYLGSWYPEGIEQKEMGKVIKEVKEKFIGVDGKMVADSVKEFIR